MVSFIRIGTSARTTYYAGDDVPPTQAKSKAVQYPTREAAEIDAEEIRRTWNLKPARGATAKVQVITE